VVISFPLAQASTGIHLTGAKHVRGEYSKGAGGRSTLDTLSRPMLKWNKN
jgi:hypothetical protein